MPPPKREYHLIIADQMFPIDWPTYTFRDADPGFDATLQTCTHHSGGQCGPGGAPFAPAKGLSGKTSRMRKRHISERTPAAARAIIKQFVVHLDGCKDARMCFNVLHNERGLSCHFILDNDGVLYQTLDLIDCGYHAAGLNETSIGIEICNRGDAKKDPGYYDDAPPGLRRDVVTCTINGNKYVAYDYTKPQYDAMQALGQALARYLPGIKLDFPQGQAAGVPSWDTLYPGDEMLAGQTIRATYSGYLGHYHITTRKWDPGPFDFKKFLGKMGGKRSFPIGLHSMNKKIEVPDPPPLANADERQSYLRVFQAYYDNNELEGQGGFFPVGPLDDFQLYHSGIHLHGKQGDNVIAPVKGKIVLARNGSPDVNIGSTNFVLIEHSEKVGNEQLNFWTLFFHLAEEKAPKKGERLKWMMSDGYENAEAGKVTILDPPEPVQAGDVIGHMGLAGPDGGEPQLHWEIFTVEHGSVERLDKQGFWKLISGGSDQRYCTNKEILGHIEKRKDGVITQEELLDHFRGDPEEREWTHHLVTYHYSEWSESPDWKLALADSPDPRKRNRRPAEIERLYEEQILPTIWWREEVPHKLKLPTEAKVYTYHPVSFLRFFNDLVGVKQVEVSRKATKEDYLTAKSGMVDLDDKDGTSFVNEAELVAVDVTKQLQLIDLIDGYGD